MNFHFSPLEIESLVPWVSLQQTWHWKKNNLNYFSNPPREKYLYDHNVEMVYAGLSIQLIMPLSSASFLSTYGLSAMNPGLESFLLETHWKLLSSWVSFSKGFSFLLGQNSRSLVHWSQVDSSQKVFSFGPISNHACTENSKDRT
jgi:hypothetical protein